MARRFPTGDGDGPPPSTLAAQIVQNQTGKAPPPRNSEAPFLPFLLNEILHNPAAVQETNLQVNVQLVSVVAEAGLLPLLQDHPLADHDLLFPLAIDSIAVIKETICRQPEVLLTPERSDGPPLSLSFIARLAAICGRPKCQELPIVQLLDNIFRVFDSSMVLSREAEKLRRAFQSCIHGKLPLDNTDHSHQLTLRVDAVEGLENSSADCAGLTLKLPPARVVSELWPESNNLAVLQQIPQAHISDRAQAFMLALELSHVAYLNAAWRDDICLRLQRMLWPLKSKLRPTGQWRYVVDRMLMLVENTMVLQELLLETATSPPASEIQISLSKALIRALRRGSVPAMNALLPSLMQLASGLEFERLHKDLKVAIAMWLGQFVGKAQLPGQIMAFQNALHGSDVVMDGELHSASDRLSTLQDFQAQYLHPHKRRRIHVESKHVRHAAAHQHLSGLVAGDEHPDDATLLEAAVEAYPGMNESDQCGIWRCLAQLASQDSLFPMLMISELTQLPELRQSQSARVLSMIALKELIQHTSKRDHLDLAKSHFGQFCLSSLHSSSRELRIAAGLCLPGFLRDELPKDLKVSNRQLALEYLRGISDRDLVNEQETLIRAWGNVALVCGDQELNLVLLRLVDYLGHSNALVTAVASEELERLAESKHLKVEELLAPYWGTIALTVVQDLNSRPQKAQQLCELLGTNVSGFLVRTQEYTIPSLILTKKKEILQRLAHARGNNSTIKDICLQPPINMSATLALLLQQPSPDPEAFAMECLALADPDFISTDIPSLVKLDPPQVACEMLQNSGGATGNRKSRIHRAFEVFAIIVERQSGKPKAHSKSKRIMADFFDSHILGIMSCFSNILGNTPGLQLQPTARKIRCLLAITDMIVLAKSQVSIALPQIRACLHSAIEQPELCESAFLAWLALLSVLDSEDIAHIIDQSFVLVVKYWSNFSPELQNMTHEKLADLLRAHNQVIQDNIMTLPSLHNIPLLAKLASEIERLKVHSGVEGHCTAFAKRLRDESETVVLQALEELSPFLVENQEIIHDSAISEQPPTSLSDLIRALLDTTIKYASRNSAAAVWCGKSLGVLGCLDPNRIEAVRKKRRTLVLSNFETASEVVEWVVVLLEDVLVNAFKSISNARAQGFLAYAMQELLRFCNFTQDAALRPRGGTQSPGGHQRWLMMPENVRLTLTPFLSSRYLVTSHAAVPTPRSYPGFTADTTHSAWLYSLVCDLLLKGKGDNAQMVFTLLARIIRGHDLAIASFVLPYAILNVVLGGTVSEVQGIANELLAVLTCPAANSAQQDITRLCSENVFAVLDYMSTWLQEKKKALGDMRATAYRTGASPNDFDEAKDMAQIENIEEFLDGIPAEAVASRSSECGSFARALFHWEKYIRQKRSITPSARMTADDEELYNRLQSIYANIDEPDGLEGIGAHLSFLTEEQQVVQHTTAGRWTAAQAWYEMKLTQDASDSGIQTSLLHCLQETGQYTSMLKYADAFMSLPSELTREQHAKVLPYALEALWMTEDMSGLEERLASAGTARVTGFHTNIAKALVTTADNASLLQTRISGLRRAITEGMTVSGTNSLHACTDELRKLHTFYEIETLKTCDKSQCERNLGVFDKRQAALGAYLQDKEFILGIRRAVIHSRSDVFPELQVGRAWLATARLARKSGKTLSAYGAVLRASECGDKGAKLEEARLLWHEGHQRQAIQALDAAISSGVFESLEQSTRVEQSDSSAANTQKQNMVLAKANLLLAKWLDISGQSQTRDLTAKYQYAAKTFQRWEKGHYSLGKHYNRLLEAEKALPKSKQQVAFQTGEMVKMVIENLMRSVPFGTKYWHETIPKLLTLWLDLGMEALTRGKGEDQAIFEKRTKTLQGVNRQIQKYCDRVPSYVFYTAFAQLISRISHPHPEVWKTLSNLLTKVVAQHPSQALWSLLAVIRSADRTRVDRGQQILNRLKDPKSKFRSDLTPLELRNMISQGQKLQDGLLHACECPIEPRKSNASLSKDLGFNHKLAPSLLVVPVEATLLVNIPNSANADAEKIRRHRPFAHDKITIGSFADDVLVLNSLQRPRKITARGTDGKQYGLLCKPKDDLRKDQRLMEFNGIINRALKRDAQSSKRRLYIKTYAVTPLSEESGTIEWVEGIKPIRDILLNIYNRKGIRPNYNDIRSVLNEACQGPHNVHLFTEQVLNGFPACLHEWFAEIYSEPDTWFNARLRYARSAAVMSITGHVLGLGDRHGENILLEEGTGGVFHVDFNCLFDKGLTFEKPELVPFRLTHNMVDAMGPYGYEGPFRKSCELTLGLLRRDKDTLMTVLETFLYDPTTDFVGGKKKRSAAGVPETPQEILDNVHRKVKGLLQGETVPLSVEGYVDALIRQAVDPGNLAGMYIGWCAFL